jgi:E3 ubiquitin-protein ligase RAD18
MASLEKKALTYASDFESTPFPALVDLDKNMRCLICHEVVDSAMITSCGHTFCALCIRQAVQLKPECPHCFKKNVQISTNWFAREIVGWWEKHRTRLLDVLKATKPPELSERQATPERKRRIEEINAAESPRYKTRGAKRRPSPPQNPAAPVVISLLDGDQTTTKRAPGNLDRAQTVPCPLCGETMRNEFMWDHLSCCPLNSDAVVRPPSGYVPPTNEFETAYSRRPAADIKAPPLAFGYGVPQPATTQLPSFLRPSEPPRSSSMQRLPVLNYGILKETALRKKLQELGIQSNGSKQMLMARHSHWLNLWNSNLEKTEPLNRRELLQDLEVWERTLGTKAPSSAAGPQATIMQKDFDRTQYVSSHHDQFKDLIAQARRTSKAKMQQSEEEAPIDAFAALDTGVPPPPPPPHQRPFPPAPPPSSGERMEVEKPPPPLVDRSSQHRPSSPPA